MRTDYVISYVDGTDPNWIDLYRQHSAVSRDDANFSVRFAPNSLLKYLFRSIDKYAAFITGIKFLVQSESQVPTWINRDTVDVVLH